MSSGILESVEAANISSEYTTKKGITSRFSNLFGKRTSHIKDFSIRLEEDGISQGIKQYGPGDHVKGKVILDVAKPLGVTHVVVRLSGFVDVFKNHKQRISQNSENGRMSKRRGRRWTSEYFGDGFASLFEDEIVVCGDGRLDPRPWHFEFSIPFPSQLDLPSSIKFERGQISYTVTAILTRPAAINPSTSIERTVRYRDNIDVARYPPPRAREATLKLINPQGSSRASLRRLTSSDKDKQPLRTSTASPLRQVEYKRDSVASSDAPASINVSSRHSSSSHATESVISIPQSLSDTPSRQSALAPHVSVGLTKGACLPGQTIHVLIKVENHHKAVWRRNGIIVTLHREGRTDFQPNLPLSASAEGQSKYEDYYPRSRSGIGGMSMDNAGSDKKFQQDLSQTIAPLLINPGTMSTEVKVAVRVPADVIPTIKGVPGNMISFRYYVETIIDIQGKLSMHDRAIAGATADPGAGEEAQMTIWAPNCIDTTSMKQHKHAVRLKSELIIGTSDSMKTTNIYHRHLPQVAVVSDSRERVESPRTHAPSWNENGVYHPDRGIYGSGTGAHPLPERDDIQNEAYDSRWGYDEYEGYDYDQWPESGGDSGYNYEYYDHETSSHGYSQSPYDPPPHFQVSADRPEQSRPFIPLPSTIDEEGLTEKQKLARHEAALLPSQPDGPETPSTQLPSAPPPLDEDEYMIAHVATSPLRPGDRGDVTETYSSQTFNPLRAAASSPAREQPHDFTAIQRMNGCSRSPSFHEQQVQQDRGNSEVKSLPETHVAHEQTIFDTLSEDLVNATSNNVTKANIEIISGEADRAAAESEPQGPIHGTEAGRSEAVALPHYQEQ